MAALPPALLAGRASLWQLIRQALPAEGQARFLHDLLRKHTGAHG